MKTFIIKSAIYGFVIGLVIGLFIIFLGNYANAVNYDPNDPEVSQAQRQWIRTQMQPDHPYISCCGQADLYWADEVYVENGQVIAVITDDRDIPNRLPRDGERIVIPPEKMAKFESDPTRRNPTGHGIVFMGTGNEAVKDILYCYYPPGGV
jgi:hypothetical protein